MNKESDTSYFGYSQNSNPIDNAYNPPSSYYNIPSPASELPLVSIQASNKQQAISQLQSKSKSKSGPSASIQSLSFAGQGFMKIGVNPHANTSLSSILKPDVIATIDQKNAIHSNLNANNPLASTAAHPYTKPRTKKQSNTTTTAVMPAAIPTTTNNRQKVNSRLEEADHLPGYVWKCVDCGVGENHTPLKRKGPDGKRVTKLKT